MPSTVGQRGDADGTATPLRDDSDFLQWTLTSVGDIVEKSGPRYPARGGHGGAVAAGSGFGLLNEPDVQLAGQPSGPRLGHAHDRWARPPQNWSAPLSAAACVTGRWWGTPDVRHQAPAAQTMPSTRCGAPSSGGRARRLVPRGRARQRHTAQPDPRPSLLRGVGRHAGSGNRGRCGPGASLPGARDNGERPLGGTALPWGRCGLPGLGRADGCRARSLAVKRWPLGRMN